MWLFNFLWECNNLTYIDILILLICSSVDEHLGCLNPLAIRNNAAVNIHIWNFAWSYVLMW